jgi:hypothetical protein
MKIAFCKVNIAPVRKESSDASEMITQLVFGEVLEVLEDQGNFLRVESLHDRYQGYCDWKHVEYISEKEMKRWLDGLGIQQAMLRKISTPWGEQVLTKGAFAPSQDQECFSIGSFQFRFLDKPEAKESSVLAFSKTYLNTPYLWGGKSAFGIDCSGFVQQVFRTFDINLPRDAYQQEEHGLLITFEERESGDLAFFTNDAGRVIHVGILLSADEIIHASGYVRIDSLTETGIFSKEYNKITHQLSSIKRL